RPRYPVLVHRAAALLRASFRPRLARTPCASLTPSPPSGWVEDFHLQAGHARHAEFSTAFRAGKLGGELLQLRLRRADDVAGPSRAASEVLGAGHATVRDPDAADHASR